MRPTPSTRSIDPYRGAGHDFALQTAVRDLLELIMEELGRSEDFRSLSVNALAADQPGVVALARLVTVMRPGIPETSIFNMIEKIVIDDEDKMSVRIDLKPSPFEPVLDAIEAAAARSGESTPQDQFGLFRPI